jgi:hypothetical protein
MPIPAGEDSNTAGAIVWLPCGFEERVLEAPLLPPLRAWRSERGFLVFGQLDRGSDRRRRECQSLGARVFIAGPAPGIWVEDGAELPAGSSTAARLGDDFDPSAEALLAGAPPCRRWRVPHPETWRALREEVDPRGLLDSAVALEAAPVARCAPAAAPAWVLRLERRQDLAPAAGLLWKRGEGAAEVAAHLIGLRSSEIRDYRFRRLGALGCLFGPRGLAPDFPLAGRPLRNLATPIEPVLIPADRSPVPALSPPRIRALFAAAEGDALIWWDGGSGEVYAVVPRSSFRVLSRNMVREEIR